MIDYAYEQGYHEIGCNPLAELESYIRGLEEKMLFYQTKETWVKNALEDGLTNGPESSLQKMAHKCAELEQENNRLRNDIECHGEMREQRDSFIGQVDDLQKELSQLKEHLYWRPIEEMHEDDDECVVLRDSDGEYEWEFHSLMDTDFDEDEWQYFFSLNNVKLR